MDNQQQIEEIIAFRKLMKVSFGIKLNLNEAAVIWIERYAKEWREEHSFIN